MFACYYSYGLLIFNLLIVLGQEILDKPNNYDSSRTSCHRDENCYNMHMITTLKETIDRKDVYIESLEARIKKLEADQKVPKFDGGHSIGRVTSNIINEASGLCSSRRHKNVLYTHNDSGGSSRIFAVDSGTGNRLATINIDGADSRDWEDIACGPCPDGGHCIYIGDVGGNVKQPGYVVYRIQEPRIIKDQNVTIESMLKYSWVEENCETLMVDPNSEVYLVSKVGPGKYCKVVQLPKSAWGTNEIVHVSKGISLTVQSETDDPVGGDISVDGKQILLKMYGHIWYWLVEDDNIINAMTKYPTEVPSRHERQGEAVCWDADGEGYYTLAEGKNSSLWYFKPKTGYYPKSVVNHVIPRNVSTNQAEFMCIQSSDAYIRRYYAAFPGASPGMQLVLSSIESGWAKLEIPEIFKCENITIEKGTTFIDMEKEMGTTYLQIEKKGIYIETPISVSVYLKLNIYRPTVSAVLQYSNLGMQYAFSNPLMREFTVVATRDQTEVNVTLHPGFRKVLYQGHRILDGDDVIKVELQRLETFSAASPYMEIVASKPIAVFTGPSNRLNQITPVEKLDTTFLIPRIFSGLPYTIYSPHDDTIVEAETDRNTTTKYQMNKFDVDGGFLTTRSHVLSSNKPIYVVFTSRDGTLYFPGIHQYKYNYSCPLLGSQKTETYQNIVHIVIKSESITGLTINGENIDPKDVRETLKFNKFMFTYISVKTSIRNQILVNSMDSEMFVFIYEILDGQRLNYLCV